MKKIFLIILIFTLTKISYSQQIEINYPPDNCTFLENNSIFFSWTQIDTAVYYELQISNDSNFTSLNLDTNITENIFNFSGTGNHFYYLRVRFFSNNFSSWSDVLKFSIISPLKISNLKGWYSADSSNAIGNIVDTLYDISGNNNNLIQNDTSQMPTLLPMSQTLHSRCIYFDGIDDFLKSQTFELDSTISVFMFFNNLDNWSYNKYILDGYNYANLRFSVNYGGLLLYCGNFLQTGNNIIDNNFNFSTIIYNSDSSVIRNNFNTLIIGDPGDNNNPQGLTLGTVGIETSNPDNYGNFDLFELLVYNKVLSDTEIFFIENYLKTKYSLPVKIKSNFNNNTFCPTTLDAGGRFTSYLWSTGDTTQTIQVNHTGTYSVTVTDIFGFQSSDSIFVQYPEPNIPFGDTILCYGDTLVWDLQLDSTLYSFSWSSGDTTQFTRIFNPGGNYFCTITDTAGCQMITDTITVSIDSFPIQALFIPHDTSICAGTNLYPANQQIYNTLWNTGDTTVYITVQDSATYTLSADNINGCHTTDSINVSIHGVAPLIDFSWDNHCFGDTTFFNNNSQLQDTSTFTTFIWQIDTLQNDTAFQTSVLFPDTVTYQITLEGYTSSNCYNITSKQIKIYPTPQVSFTQPHICQHSQATITPQINSAYQIENYLWQLDNTETATTPYFTHTFDSVATHNISISITDENGCGGEFSSTVEVLPSPVANFYTTNQCQNTTIIFHDSTVSEFYNPVVSSLWNINNNTLEGNTVSHIFDTSGYFPVTHFVTAVNGCKDTITKNVRIYPTPHMQILDTTYLCANTKETLSVQIPDSVLPVTYSWSIDSTAYSNECCPEILFTDTGYHNLEVTTTTTHNCTETKESVINVLPQPSADFDVYLASHKVTSNYLLDDAVYHVIAKDTSYPHYFWSSYFFSFTEFEDFEWGYDMNIQTIYGDGMIVLRVVDQNGCQDTSYFSYHVYSPFDEMDLRISNVSYTKQNDFIFPIVTIKNQGNSPAKPYITCELKGSGKIMEQIDKVIYPGNSYTYSFRSGIEQNSEPLILCAYIVYPWLDNYEHNSEKCITDNSETISIVNIYPQPANNQLNVDLIFNIGNGDIYFYFLNSLGQKTAYFSKTVSKGYNHLTFDISSLPAGEYFLKIIAGSQLITKRFIKK